MSSLTSSALLGIGINSLYLMFEVLFFLVRVVPSIFKSLMVRF